MGPALYMVHLLSPYYEAMDLMRQGGLATIQNCLWYIYGALLQQGEFYDIYCVIEEELTDKYFSC